MTVFEKPAIVYALYFTYLALLSGLYYIYLVPAWSYTGFIWQPESGNIFASLAAFFLLVFFVPKGSDTRALFCNLLLAVYLIPSLVVFSFRGFELASALVIWFAVLVVYLVSSVRLPLLQVASASGVAVVGWLAVSTLASIVMFIVFGGLENFNLDLSQVYDVRDAAAEGLPGLFAYLGSTISKVFIPFGVVLSIFYKKRGFLWFFAISSILMFGITSHKSVVAFAIAAALFYLFLRSGGKFGLILGILVASSGLSLILVVITDVTDGASSGTIISWFSSLFVRRSLMVPPLLDFHYLEFFRYNPNYYWSDSRITLNLIRNPYGGEAMPYVIGLLYFNDVSLGANTGFIGSGFGQAGFIGVFVYSVAVGLVISILNSAGNRVGHPIVFSATLGIVLTMFSSADFVTTILNHGLAFALIILAFLRPASQPVIPPGHKVP